MNNAVSWQAASTGLGNELGALLDVTNRPQNLNFPQVPNPAPKDKISKMEYSAGCYRLNAFIKSYINRYLRISNTERLAAPHRE